MTESFVFDPVFSRTVIIVIIALAAVVTLLSLWRMPRGGVFRLAALAGLVGLLLNPQVREADLTALPDIVVLLVDRSASQTLNNRDAITTAAEEKIAADLSALGDVEIRTLAIAGADRTAIGEAFEQAVGETARARLAGVVVITDGQSADEIDVSGLPPEAPVHVMLTGAADEQDRRISLIKAPRYGIVDEAVDVSFRIDDLGIGEIALDGAPSAIVSLRVNGEEALRQPVPIGEEVSFSAPLESPGKTVIELEAAPLNGELTVRNNIAVLPISVIRDRLRVLLISGKPHPGERVWRNLLKSDPAIDLVHFTILRPTEKAQSDGALERELALIEFPQDELFIEKLNEFDLVIFDRYTYRGVLNAYHFDNIARYVEGGGAVLVSSGPEYNGILSLAARRNFSFILPAVPVGDSITGPFRPRLSDDGARHPVTAKLPDADIWGRWLRIMPATMRDGRALMEGPNKEPLLVLNRVGQGRVGVILSDHVWLWARGFEGGGPHAELLRRIAHWLMKEPELEEESLSLSDGGDDLVIERRSMADSADPVSITLPDGSVNNIDLVRRDDGVFAATLTAPPRGLYRGRTGDLFDVGAVGLAAPQEFDNVVSTARVLGAASEATRGGVFNIRSGDTSATPQLRPLRPEARERAGADWAGIVRRGAERRDSVFVKPLLPPVVWLVAIGVSLLLAWWIEGRRARKRGK